MTSELARPTGWWTPTRVIAVVIAVLLVASVAWVLSLKASQDRESDRRTDSLYCTMAGISPTDRGPETGELCADLLGY